LDGTLEALHTAGWSMIRPDILQDASGRLVKLA